MKTRLFLSLAILAFVTGCSLLPKPIDTKRPIPPAPVGCTREAKQCPDGSYVGRSGPDCEFTPCPNPIPTPPPTGNCTKDSDCPSPQYACQATQGSGTVYPNNGRPPTYTIIKGECKLREGGTCSTDNDCLSGLICHSGICTSPRGNTCSGPDDASCPTGYQCIQACGPPVARVDDPPPPYYCELNEIANKPRNCPICLASNSEIATPTGAVNVKDITIGMQIWSVNNRGEKIVSTVQHVSRTLVPRDHRVIHIVLADGREAWVSPNHPLVNGLTAGQLVVGSVYDGSRVSRADSIPYWDTYTYDLLPNSDTGEYWVNGIVMKSTLR